MSNLIDKDSFAARVLPLCTYPESLQKMLDEEPTVSIGLVRSGKWIDMENKRNPKCSIVSYGKGYGMCSECQTVEWLYKGKKYCPYCGTKLDQEEHDGVR